MKRFFQDILYNTLFIVDELLFIERREKGFTRV